MLHRAYKKSAVGRWGVRKYSAIIRFVPHRRRSGSSMKRRGLMARASRDTWRKSPGARRPWKRGRRGLQGSELRRKERRRPSKGQSRHTDTYANIFFCLSDFPSLSSLCESTELETHTEKKKSVSLRITSTSHRQSCCGRPTKSVC